MPTELEAQHLAYAIRGELRYIAARINEVTWGNQLQPFADEGEAIAVAIERALRNVALVEDHPKQATGQNAAATARLGPLTLTAAEVGEAYNGMTATWALGATPPEQAAGFSGGATPTVGYVNISGNPTEDFDGVVEITADGGVGVGSYRFSDDGGQSWGSPQLIADFAHLGVTVTFADTIDVPDVVTEAIGELPLVANYVAPAQASWSSRGFDRLTLTHAGQSVSYDYLRPGATWFVQGSAASEFVTSAEWSAETRPFPSTVIFSGGSSQTLPPTDEAGPFRRTLNDAYSAGIAWRRKWNIELSSYVVTRSPTPPPSL